MDAEDCFVEILDEDPDLGETLSAEDRRLAKKLLRARVIDVQRRGWEPPRVDPRSTYGLLVLEGLLGRRTRVGHAMATELVGPGDIVRPWEEPCPWILPPEVDWRILSPARLAVLDERITRLIGRRPELMVAFSNRLLRRVRSAQYLRAVSSLHRLEDRLLSTLWWLATNWGTVTPRGVRIPFRVTHEVLAEVIGARRPSVTVAFQALRHQEQVNCDRDGRYVLTGNPGDWNRTAAVGAERVAYTNLPRASGR